MGTNIPKSPATIIFNTIDTAIKMDKLTTEEIENWETYDDKERLEIIRQLHSRRIAAGGRGRRQTSRRNKRR